MDLKFLILLSLIAFTLTKPNKNDKVKVAKEVNNTKTIEKTSEEINKNITTEIESIKDVEADSMKEKIVKSEEIIVKPVTITYSKAKIDHIKYDISGKDETVLEYPKRSFKSVKVNNKDVISVKIKVK